MNIVSSILLVFLVAITLQSKTTLARKPMRAVCDLVPDPNTDRNIRGRVVFKQWKSPAFDHLRVSVRIRGLEKLPWDSPITDRLHGFHVHQNGDISGGCGSAGGHYNPAGVNHGGSRSNERHVGDLGNVIQTPNGRVRADFYDPVASLYGDHSIIGRAIVLHANADDLGQGGDAGSLATGNAGPRLACCVIKDATRR